MTDPDPKLVAQMVQDVFGAFLPTSSDESKTVKILAWPWLRVRSGPGATYKAVSILLYGKTAQAVDVKDVGSDQWAKLTDGNWIALRYAGQRLAEFVE